MSDIENQIDESLELEDEVDDTPAPAAPGEKVKYITNKELLAEIHKSKVSYCACPDKAAHSMYDAIVMKIDEITPDVIEAARTRKAHLMSQAAKAMLRAQGAKQSALKEAVVDPSTIPTNTIVFRVMTSQHIPLDPDRKRKGKGENADHKRTPFLPFKHFIIQEDGTFKEVLRSHWRGTFEDGCFDMDKGQMTHRLAVMFMMLVDRYSRRSNWRGYTYLDEMKSHALLQLSQIGLQFDESKSDNPFAFYTTTIKNCFTRVLNLEKKNQNIRDDILIMNGANPSYTRMNDYEYERGMAAHNSAVETTSGSEVEAGDDA